MSIFSSHADEEIMLTTKYFGEPWYGRFLIHGRVKDEDDKFITLSDVEIYENEDLWSSPIMRVNKKFVSEGSIADKAQFHKMLIEELRNEKNDFGWRIVAFMLGTLAGH